MAAEDISASKAGGVQLDWCSAKDHAMELDYLTTSKPKQLDAAVADRFPRGYGVWSTPLCKAKTRQTQGVGLMMNQGKQRRARQGKAREGEVEAVLWAWASIRLASSRLRLLLLDIGGRVSLR